MSGDRRPVRDFRTLPRLRDRLSYLYVEHCRVDKQDQAVALHDEHGRTHVPLASLALLLAGPGTVFTHQAITTLADNNCLVAWCGEQGVRMYAHGVGGSRSARPLLRQAEMVVRPELRLMVARRMYAWRFPGGADPALSLEQLRGWEGRRVRDAYAQAARVAGIPWHGRSYDRRNWSAADPANRALTSANACLYGICHAAALSLGLSPGLGFIHTGSQLSFVYDLADLYKTEIAVPAAFQAAAEGSDDIERRARLACRDRFQETNLLERITRDIPEILDIPPAEFDAWFGSPDDPGLRYSLWDPDRGAVEGGANYSEHVER